MAKLKAKEVYEGIKSKLKSQKPILLHGVTASGKTEVYFKLIKDVIDSGKNVLFLAPEIALASQLTLRLIKRFNSEEIAIWHSSISEGEKFDVWNKIRENKIRIIIGARSAIFAPLKNLGIIVIDEEHTQTYKQDNHPRYNAKDVAILRGKYNNCPVLFGSATPSMESFARATNNVYKLLTLTKRAGNGTLPNVSIVDMRNEIKKGNFILSKRHNKKRKN